MEHDGARWEPARLAAQGGDDVAALVYRAYLLGGDARVSTWHGVVSAKAVAADPLTGAPTPIMRISGAGSALAELGRDNLVEFMLDRLQQLRARYVGRATAAYLIQAALRHCAFNRHHGQGPTTTLHHAAAPAAHVDELCGGAVMAIASCGDGAAIVEAIFAGRLGWLDRCHPGPELADRLGRAIAGHPQWHGVIVGGHGLIGWGDTAEACYRRSIVAIAACEQFFGARRRRPGAYARPVPAGQVEPNRTLTSLLPILRGLASRQTRVVIHGDDRPETLAAIDAGDLAHLFGPTMRLLVLDRKLIDDDPAIVKRVLAERLDAHGAAMAGDAPLAFLWPGAGLFGFGADKREARRVVESYMDAINALYDARAISTGGVAWIEPSVANSSPTDEVLARRVAVITGAAGGIGRAIADRFAAAGAAVVLADRDGAALASTAAGLADRVGRDNVLAVETDVRDEASVEHCFARAIRGYGGVDILVNNAGLSRGGDIVDFPTADYDLLSDVMARGAFLCARAFARCARAQGLGGDVIYVVSKNAVFAGPANVAYGSVKAAQLHQARLLAAELGKDGVRVNAINPDAVVQGSGIWSGGWAEERAKAYGVAVSELGAYYAKRTLLNVEILPDDIAAAALCLVGGALSKTTGAVIPVDGGIPAAFPR